MSEQQSGQGGFSTRAIHAGQEPDASTGAVITPIYQVSTYKQDGIGGFRGGYEYSRSANPTRTALEECFAALEGGARGFVAGPFDAWLVLRGLKTLALRMERHSDNAERVVEFLQSHPAVSAVHYPGLPSHPGHEVAKKQMRRFGGMISFQLKAGEDVAVKVCAETQVWTLGESLGGVESLIEHPARMTHASVAGTELEVPADLIRLSVGIEDVEDLIADLKQALDRLA